MSSDQSEKKKPNSEMVIPYNPDDAELTGIELLQNWEDILDYFDKNAEMKALFEEKIGKTIPQVLDGFAEGKALTCVIVHEETGQGVLCYFPSDKHFFIISFREYLSLILFFIQFVFANKNNHAASVSHIMTGIAVAANPPQNHHNLQKLSRELLASLLEAFVMVKERAKSLADEELAKHIRGVFE